MLGVSETGRVVPDEIGSFVCALALGKALVPTVASTDDPRDPAMRSAAARARDKAIIKRLNLEQLANAARSALRPRLARLSSGFGGQHTTAGAERTRKKWPRGVARWSGAMRATGSFARGEVAETVLE